MEKICNQCKEPKKFQEFYKQKNGKFGLSGKCKSCCSENGKRSYKNDPERFKKTTQRYFENNPGARQRTRIKYHYNLTMEEYQKLIEEHENKCAVCDKPRSELKKELDIDHCHTTGKIRGLLCPNCNKALGLLNDDPSVIERLLNYIKT